MFAICDVKEYRNCVRLLNSPLVSQLFDILHALCNLLLVKHENLQEVCGGETLASISLHYFSFLCIQINEYYSIIFTELFGQIGRVEFHSIA